ncbi:MAG TPA: hypothetical protein VI488_06680 [Candidatus Angelobacter sp.]
MASRIPFLFIMLAGMSAIGSAQQACSAIEVPVGVISTGGETFRGLSAQDFLSSKGSTVKSLVFDNGPRRVLIVVDTGAKLSANARQAATELVNALVGASRPEDSLALITARGPGGEAKFGGDPSEIARALAAEGGSTHSKQGVLDALMEGIGWFSEPKVGDAIVVIAADLEGNHKTNPKAVAKAVADHHLRVFGLALGPVIAKSTVATSTITSTTSQGLAYSTPLTGVMVLQDGDTNFYPLVTNSGGLLLTVVDASPDKGAYNLNDPKVQEQVRYKARQTFGMITVFYRLQVESHGLSHPQDWTLDVNQSLRKNQPPMFLLYPHELGPC